MADPVLDMYFDSASLQRIQRLWNYEKYLDPLMQIAMEKSVDLLQSDAILFMGATFKNDTGQLAGTVETEVVNPYEGQVWTDSPYAWRREEGFSGMTDSLGRYYPDDPGIHFFATVLKEDKPFIRDYIKEAIQISLDLMGA